MPRSCGLVQNQPGCLSNRLSIAMTQRKDPPYYELDKETHEMLEAVLNMIGGVAELQADDNSREDIFALGDEVATRFGINLITIEASPGQTPEGENVTVLRYRSDSTEKSPPKLTVVSDNTDKPRSGPPPENDNKS